MFPQSLASKAHAAPSALPIQVLPCSPCEPRSLLCVASFSRGFIAGSAGLKLAKGTGCVALGGEKGIVTFYERSDDAKAGRAVACSMYACVVPCTHCH